MNPLFAQIFTRGGILTDEPAFGTMSVVWIVAMAASVFWFMAFVDAINREPAGNAKFFWAVVILAVPVVGALVYLLVRRPMQRHVYHHPGRLP